MRYYLRNPKTKSVSSAALVPPALQQDAEMYGRISRMSGLRETMRDQLKAQTKVDDFSRVGGVLSATQAYLVELHWYIEFYENNQSMFKDMPSVEFIWKSAIISRLHDKVNLSRPKFGSRGAPAADSDGGGNAAAGSGSGGGQPGGGGGMRLLGGGSFKQRRTQSTSIYMELGFTLLALAIGKCMSAYAKVETLDTEIECEAINSMTPGVRIASDEENEQMVEALKRAALELREAAGVFEYIVEHVLPKIKHIRLGVPDLNPGMQYMLQTLALADSDRLSVRVWLRTDKYRRKTPNMPANLLLGIQERYNNAYSTLRTMQGGEFRNVSTDIQSYMRDGQLVIMAQAMIYLAQVHNDSQKFGNAVGFMRDARELLTDVKKRNQSVHAKTAEMLLSGPLEPLYSLYRRNNDTIGFELVPSPEDLRARLPSGRTLFSKLTVYQPRAA